MYVKPLQTCIYDKKFKKFMFFKYLQKDRSLSV